MVPIDYNGFWELRLLQKTAMLVTSPEREVKVSMCPEKYLPQRQLSNCPFLVRELCPSTKCYSNAYM